MAKIFGLENISWWALVTCSNPILSFPAISAISVALLQMSRALLASPDKLATFLATNWMASAWNIVRPSSLLATIVCNWVWVYGWKTCLVRPSLLLTLFIITLSGRSMVLAIAMMISLLSGFDGQSKMLYKTDCFLLQSMSNSSTRNTVGILFGLWLVNLFSEAMKVFWNINVGFTIKDFFNLWLLLKKTTSYF